MMFTANSLAVYFNNDDDPDLFDLEDHDTQEGWQLCFTFEPGWLIVYYFDQRTGKNGNVSAYPSDIVRELSADAEGLADEEEPEPEEPEPESEATPAPESEGA